VGDSMRKRGLVGSRRTSIPTTRSCSDSGHTSFAFATRAIPMHRTRCGGLPQTDAPWRRHGQGSRRTQCGSVSSGVAPIFVESSGQNRIWVVKGANDHLLPEDVDGAADLLRRAEMIVLQLEVPLETVYYTLRFAREHRIRTILNPAPGQPLDLRQAGAADYVIPNETEAEALGGVTTAQTCTGTVSVESWFGVRRPPGRGNADHERSQNRPAAIQRLSLKVWSGRRAARPPGERPNALRARSLPNARRR
jgi:pfkB family carbohydrate kinase